MATAPAGDADQPVLPAQPVGALPPRRLPMANALCRTLGIPREDKAARLELQLAKNAEFFGAPVSIFVCVDERMACRNGPTWASATLMLLAVHHGSGDLRPGRTAPPPARCSASWPCPSPITWPAAWPGLRDEGRAHQRCAHARARADWGELRGFD